MKHTDFLWVLPFLSFFAGYSVLHYVYTYKIETPVLVGKQLPDALGVLSEYNLNPRIIGHKDDADLPEGTIISQMPHAHTTIKPHQSVFLVTSKKPKSKAAANYIGKQIAHIEQETAKNGITLKKYYVMSTQPSGTCIAQSINPHTPIGNEGLLVYVASDHKKPYIMPNVCGKAVAPVQQLFDNYPVTMNVSHPHTPEHVCSECVIVEQRPLAGSMVAFDDQKPLQLTVRTQ